MKNQPNEEWEKKVRSILRPYFHGKSDVEMRYCGKGLVDLIEKARQEGREEGIEESKKELLQWIVRPATQIFIEKKLDSLKKENN